MSWREESTFKRSSALVEEEKEFLKLAKKIREILKLEEKAGTGEALEEKQQEKVASKEKLLKEIIALATKLPGQTEVLEKNQDITKLLPSDAVRSIDKKRQQQQNQRQRREEEEVTKRKQHEFMSQHDRPILGITVSRDCKYLYTCSKDKYVICWSLAESRLESIVTYGGHSGAVWAVDASATSSWLLSGGADSKVMLWQADPSRHRPGSVVPAASTLDHGGIVRVLRWCPFDDASDGGQRFASASEKLGSKPPAIAVWRVDAKGRFEKVLFLEEPKTKANDLQWGGGAKPKLFSAHDNGYIAVWLAEAPGSLLKTIKLHSGPVAALCLAGDGSVLVTASHDRTSVAVDMSRREMDTLATYKADRPLNAVAVSADFSAGAAGAVVVAGGQDPRDVTTSKELVDDEFEAKVLDAEAGTPYASGKGHFGPVHALLALPSLGSYGAFASASEDGCLKVHSLRDGRLLHSSAA